MAKKECLQCGKPKGLVAANYAGKSVPELSRGGLVKFAENYSGTLPGSAVDDFLCAECAAKFELTCGEHGAFTSAMMGGTMTGSCSGCLAAAEAAKEEARAVAAVELETQQAEQAAEQAALAEKMDAIPVTTGDVRWEYEIERVVFNIGASSGMLGNWIKASPDAAFRRAEMALKAQAAALNCDAVIHTQFEHRITVTAGAIGGTNQGIEVFAYGTAVRRK